ncbi:MAG TPA: hypothetical protein VGH28_15315 [Polyangiaceae bacterium]|jgi:hypothetical protein
MMLRRAAPLLLFAVAALVDAPACMAPTEISFVITTDLPCSAIVSTAVSVGALGPALDAKAPDSVSTVCQNGSLGTLVVTPTGSRDEELAARIVTGTNGTSAETCIQNGFAGNCIVARRSLHFIPHTPTVVNVQMQAACVNDDCDPLSTCDKGSCVSPDADCDGGPCGDAQAPPGIVPTTIVANAGALPFVVGFGAQVHLIWAQQSQQAWFFWVDSANASQVRARFSSDFVTWNDAGSLDLNGGTLAFGSNFSVAYALLGNTDVLHLVANVDNKGSLQTIHVRAVLTPGAIVAPQVISYPNTRNGGSCPQDGPSTVVASDGHVFDVTAWTDESAKGTTCDTDVYRSPTVDPGGTGFSMMPGPQVGYYVSQPTFAFTHQLVALGSGGVVTLTYPDWDPNTETNFQSVGFAQSNNFGDVDAGVFEPQSQELFGVGMGESSLDDWATCALSDTDVHVVRHVLDATAKTTSQFQHASINGATGSQLPDPPSVAGNAATGLALVGGVGATSGMLLATIDTGGVIQIQHWTAAAGWSTAATIPAGAAPRAWIAGSGCGSLHPRIVWAEGSTNGPFTIYGADVSSLLQP